MCDSSSSRACQFPGTHLPKGSCKSQSKETPGYGPEGSYETYEVKQDQVCDNFSKLWKNPVKRYEHFTFEVFWYLFSIIVGYTVNFKVAVWEYWYKTILRAWGKKMKSFSTSN